MVKFSKLRYAAGVLLLSAFLAAGASGRPVLAAETKNYTIEELEVIDGGDAEYWKYYDAQGNPVENSQVEEEGPRKRAIEEGEVSIKSPYTNKTYEIPEGYIITHGVDVSKWQDTIDWNKVKANGVDSVIIRCGYRTYGSSGSLNDDSCFESHIQGALNAGLKVGAYVYSQAITEEEARDEAELCIRMCEPYLEQMDLPIIMDVEYAYVDGAEGGRLHDAALSVSKQTAVCKAFCRRIADRGYQPMVYANKSFLTSNVDPSALTDIGYQVWLARYNTYTGYNKSPFLIWQYADNGTVDGITDTKGAQVKVDMNFVMEEDPNAAPKWNMSKLSSAGDCINLRWAPTDCFVEGYQMQRRVDSGSFKTLKDIQAGAALLYSDYSIGAGHTYDYRMRTYYTKNGELVYGNWSDIATVSTDSEAPAIPVLKKAEALNYHTIQITWDKVDGAEGYRVYRKTAGEDWVRIADKLTDATYKDTAAGCETEYIYTVRSYRVKDGETLWSSYDKNGVSAKTSLEQTVLRSAKAINYHSIQVSWNPAGGAEGYRVYRKTEGTSWKRIADNVAETVYTDSKAEIGAAYTYTVRAYCMADGKKVLGSYDKTGVSGQTALEIPKLVKASSVDYRRIKLYWEAVDGAEGYRIYRKPKGGSFKRLTDVSADAVSYVDANDLVSGVTYVYTVRAYRVVEGEKVLSEYEHDGITGKCIPSKPTLTVTSEKSKKAVLSWKKISGADGYILYAREKGSDTWTRIKTIRSGSTLTWTASAQSKKTMEYRMRVYRKVDDQNVYSKYSDVKSVKIK